MSPVRDHLAVAYSHCKTPGFYMLYNLLNYRETLHVPGAAASALEGAGLLRVKYGKIAVHDARWTSQQFHLPDPRGPRGQVLDQHPQAECSRPAGTSSTLSPTASPERSTSCLLVFPGDWRPVKRTVDWFPASRARFGSIPPKCLSGSRFPFSSRESSPAIVRLRCRKASSFRPAAASSKSISPRAIWSRRSARTFGTSWRVWNSTSRTRAAYYTNLPPGRYRFRVLATDGGSPDWSGRRSGSAPGRPGLDTRCFWSSAHGSRARCTIP